MAARLYRIGMRRVDHASPKANLFLAGIAGTRFMCWQGVDPPQHQTFESDPWFDSAATCDGRRVATVV
ncbi:hypothetical protein F444_19438 [Phytophthora nicotianae P1976]|uniref:Uncharacterized protein n=1 Tax=Phytophthora nicotianae P1976 TaxID=1317066 RepID=A0A080Z7S6_PHYNI|nr:hypothetical protein F444_19438 [Phytophthora nicotianae P1976]